MSTGRYRRNRLKALGAFQDDLCFFCEEPLVYLDPRHNYSGNDKVSNNPLGASFDHYIARRDGGGGTRENTVIAHRDCNSKKGHKPTPDLDAKLRLLNVKRGYGDENGTVHEDRLMRRLRPEEFGGSTPALIYLCDLANAIEGASGEKIRKIITRRIQNHSDLLRQLSVIEEPSLRWEATNAVLERRRALQANNLPEPLDQLVDNVCKTITRAKFRKSLSKNARKLHRKMLREMTDEQRVRHETRTRERDALAEAHK